MTETITVHITDRAEVGQPRRTSDGYLVADAKVARTGIQLYRGVELGRPDLDVVRVYRPPEEVFATDTMSTLAYRPITNDHKGVINAENWKQHAIGVTGAEVMRDGAYARVSLALMDQAAISDYEKGKRELSMGYDADIVFEDGVTPEGEGYDALQRKIRNNHLALVDRARGGDQLRIGDGHTPSHAELVPTNGNHGGPSMATETLKRVVVDGLTIETTEQGEQAIAKLQSTLADAQTAHTQALADKDAELAKKDAEIDSLKSKVLSDADLDERVRARADLVSAAKTIADADYTGKTDAEIRAAVVRSKFGDASVEGKSDEYIRARFDILVEDAKVSSGDPVHRALADGHANRQPVADADKAYADNVSDLTNAWQRKQA